MDSLVALARKAVETWTLTGRDLDPPADLFRELPREPRACFVSLHSHGELRGCIGTLEPSESGLPAEILRNAVAACSRDRRFPPLRAEELPALEVRVDVLSPLEPIPGPEFLDPGRYGVVVESRDGRRGVLLPDLEGIVTAEQQLAIARRKAGIGPAEAVGLLRFTVERHA